jgi:hypothetical protein
MRHHASPSFWQQYANLPEAIQQLADKKYALLKANSQHPSLHFKQIGRFWSVRVGLGYRALAVEIPEGLVWFWIGTHAEYDRLISRG